MIYNDKTGKFVPSVLEISRRILYCPVCQKEMAVFDKIQCSACKLELDYEHVDVPQEFVGEFVAQAASAALTQDTIEEILSPTALHGLRLIEEAKIIVEKTNKMTAARLARLKNFVEAELRQAGVVECNNGKVAQVEEGGSEKSDVGGANPSLATKETEC